MMDWWWITFQVLITILKRFMRFWIILVYLWGNGSGSNRNANNTENLKTAFEELALLDSEVVPVREVMQKYNWTETSLHYHLLCETPKILFLHWSVIGDANELIKQAKEMIMQTSTYENLTGNSKTPSSAGDQYCCLVGQK